jgi:hypothetical protein
MRPRLLAVRSPHQSLPELLLGRCAESNVREIFRGDVIA